MSFKSPSREINHRRDPMQEFADQIVEQLEPGAKPLVRPWNPDLCLGRQAPRNAATITELTF